MGCVICRHCETEPGHTTVTLERGRAVLVFRNVPAQVCPNCGEAYLSEDVTARLLKQGFNLIQHGLSLLFDALSCIGANLATQVNSAVVFHDTAHALLGFHSFDHFVFRFVGLQERIVYKNWLIIQCKIQLGCRFEAVRKVKRPLSAAVLFIAVRRN